MTTDKQRLAEARALQFIKTAKKGDPIPGYRLRFGETCGVMCSCDDPPICTPGAYPSKKKTAKTLARAWLAHNDEERDDD